MCYNVLNKYIITHFYRRSRMNSTPSENPSKKKKEKKIKPIGADGHRARMFARFLNSESNFLSRDIIEMLLYFSIPVRDTRDAAVMLNDRFNGDIREMLNADADILTKIPGVGKTTAAFLNTVGELVSRIDRAPTNPTPLLRIDPESVFSALYPPKEQEEVWVAYFDGFGHPVDLRKIDIDLKSIKPSDVSAIIRHAKNRNAVSVAVAHIIDSPDSFPTVTDANAQKQIASLLDLSGISFSDYLIVNADETFKMHQGRLI